MFLLLLIEHAFRVLHPASILFILLALLTLLTPLAALVLEMARHLFGTPQRHSIRWTALTTVPFGLCALWGGYAYVCYSRRDVPNNLSMKLMVLAASSVTEARAVYLMPHRLETQRLIMFYDDRVIDPSGDAEAMEQHLARMEELTGLRLRTKIFYIRGPIFDERYVSFLGLAFGTPHSPPPYVDLHELAHATINQSETNDSDPPTLLTEGWAESRSVSKRDLAQRALQERQNVSQWGLSLAGMSAEDREDFRRTLIDPEHFLHLADLAAAHGGVIPSWFDELTTPRWYHHDAGVIYPVGGAFTNYLIAHYGAGKFIQLYFAVRPGRFDEACQRILGTDAATLERDFWIEQERLVKAPPH
jgi:hypothetical protein